MLWKRNKWDGSERIVVSGRVFSHLEGALYVQGDASTGRFNQETLRNIDELKHQDRYRRMIIFQQSGIRVP